MITTDERAAITQAIKKFEQLDADTCAKLLAQTKAAPVVKIGSVTLSAAAKAELLHQVELLLGIYR